MQQFLLFLLAGAATIAGAEDGDLAAEIKKLREENARLREGLKTQEGGAFSFTGAAKRAAGLTRQVTNHLLDQTDLDDKLVEHASTYVGKASAITTDAVNKVASVDYAGVVQDVTAHPIYVTHVAPQVEKLTTVARPYVDKYVNPAMEKASVHLEPAMKIAKEQYGKVHKTIREDVMPQISAAHGKAMEQVSDKLNNVPAHLDKAHSALHTVVSPPFDAVHRIAPDHAKDLPRHPVDRLLLIVVMCFVLYHTSWIIVKVLKLKINVSVLLVKIGWWLFSVFVLFPLKIAYRVVMFFLWISTIFGCCGLCCRSRKKEAPKDGKKTNGKTDSAKTNGPAKDATVEEITDLLEKAKKNNKLEAAAKELVKKTKNGEALTGPPTLKGRKAPKEVVKKAIQKFKELDLKKLGL